MKIRLTLDRPGASPVDLAVTCDATIRIGEVAAYLAQADPTRPRHGRSSAGLTIEVVGAVGTLDPARLVAESGLKSGQVVRLKPVLPTTEVASAKAVAVLNVLAGPDAGKDFQLLAGSNVVGRGRNCQVRLTDTFVSNNHVRINVTDHVEVSELGSAGGLIVNGEQTERRVLRTDDQVKIGETVFTLRLAALAATQGRVEGTDVGFIRSPRLAGVYQGQTFDAPEPPEIGRRPRFPFVSLLAPILMAGILYAITRELLSLLFIALSPIMMLGSYVEQVLSLRAERKAALKQFREDIAMLVCELDQSRGNEVAGRLAEQPAIAECVDAVNALSPLLWTRRVDAPGFCEFRVGLGTQPARDAVVLPKKSRGPRALHAELAAAVAGYELVHGVPVVASPGVQGGLGVCGQRQLALGLARSVVMQGAALHSPTELVIAAVLSADSIADWDFLKWLPHNGGINSPLSGDHLAASAGVAEALIAEVELLLKQRAADKDAESHGPALPVVLLLVESDAPVEYARLVRVAEQGWRHGIYVLWVAPELAQLPASCRVFVDLTAPEVGAVGYLHSADLVFPVAVESLGADVSLSAARRMAPIVDLATKGEDDSDLPRNASFLELVGSELADRPTSVIQRWRENCSITTGPYAPEVLPRKAGNLRGILGQTSAGLHALDLRADGPHALVGGTTGSGKSELLQTWILAMAAQNSPQRLTFLLVDYKGGAAFAECSKLPHTVGLVTDLNTNGVRRALTSLRAELKHREHLLEKYKAKDLASLEKSHPEAAPPSLVIVVDEFAALVSEVPEFVDGVVDVAQRGRSLGLHLILATQRPAGVIKGSLRANTNLRIALRVADVDDSNDVIADPMAAYFDQELPGRAVSKTGPGRFVTFQTGYVGGHTVVGEATADLLVEELDPLAHATWEPPAPETAPIDEDPGPTDISRLVGSMREAFTQAALPAPRKPWLPELAAHYWLGDLGSPPLRDCLVFAKADDAQRQSQPTVAFYPDRQGNLAIYGAGGCGKSTLLRTLACAAGGSSADPWHVYGIDFGARSLAILEELPHVGSIIAGSDDERIGRLLKWLREEIDERSRRYSKYNASTIDEFRRQARQPGEPRIMLLLDGLSAFRAAYEGTLNQPVWDGFVGIAADGRPVGVHVVVTADRVNAIPTALASSMQARLVMRMPEANDYSFLGMPADVLDEKSPAGRGLMDGREIQVAMVGKSPDNQAQLAAIQSLVPGIRQWPQLAASPIRSLPELIPADTLPVEHEDKPVIGIRSVDLAPWTIEPKGAFVVTGPAGSGRTTTVLAIREAMQRRDPGTISLLLAPRASELERAPWRRSAIGTQGVVELAVEVVEQLDAGSVPKSLVVVIESVAEFAETEAEQPLIDLIRALIERDLFVVLEGEVATLSSGYSDLLNSVRAARAGVCLQPDSGDGSAVFRTDFPTRLSRASFCPGRGLLVWRSKTTLGQIMLPTLG